MEKIQLKTQSGKVKGDYVMVNERLKYFRENYEDWSLKSEIISNENGVIIFKAAIVNPEGMVKATGHAMEKQGSSFINKTSHVENCETSAWGRALANFGIGIDTSVASYEEVANAKKQQNDVDPEKVELVRDWELTFGKNKGKKVMDIDSGYLQWLSENAREKELQAVAGKELRFRSLLKMWRNHPQEIREEIADWEPETLKEIEEAVELAQKMVNEND